MFQAHLALITVVETPEFLGTSRKLLDDAEREAMVLYLAARPTAGRLIPGTGGVRKVRWALEGRGKRGGARVIYFFYNDKVPIFLLSVFAKNEHADLSQAERNGLRRLAGRLVESYLENK